MKNITGGDMMTRQNNKMNMKVIKNEADYQAALKRLENLIKLYPKQGSAEMDQLEVLSVLIGEYEKQRYPFDLPDAISAIKFVMDQRDLHQADLEPYIGSKGRVSEVLSGKRKLSKKMIRALHDGLNIPLDILLKEEVKRPEEVSLEWEKFPLQEMYERGWFGDFRGGINELREYAEELVRPIIESLYRCCGNVVIPRTAAGRTRTQKEMDSYALLAWQAKIVEVACKNPLPSKFPGKIDEEFLSRIAQLSFFDNGPLYAKEFLNKNGISLIIEPRFNKTYLDGAVMLLTDGTPVIGLTLRYDRLDNFWFTLIHELAHLMKHFKKDDSPIFDDLDKAGDEIENEADHITAKALLPAWNTERSKRIERTGSLDDIKSLARDLHVHEAILAGRIQHDTGNYKKYRKLLGNGEPSKKFTNIPT